MNYKRYLMFLLSVVSLQLVGMQENNLRDNADNEYDPEVITFLHSGDEGSSGHSDNTLYLQLRCEALQEQLIQYQYEHDQAIRDYDILNEKYKRSLKAQKKLYNTIMNLNALVFVLKRDLASRVKNDDVIIKDA